MWTTVGRVDALRELRRPGEGDAATSDSPSPRPLLQDGTDREGAGMDVEREWLDLVATVLATPLTTLPEERLAATLMLTFDATACAFHCRRAAVVVQRIYPEGLIDAAQQAEWHRLAVEEPTRHPLLHYYLRTGDPAPRQVADVPAVFAGPAVRSGWVEWSRCHGVEHQLAIPLPVSADGLRWFVVGRSEPFAPDLMLLARRVQRIVVGLDRQVAALRPV